MEGKVLYVCQGCGTPQQLVADISKLSVRDGQVIFNKFKCASCEATFVVRWTPSVSYIPPSKLPVDRQPPKLSLVVNNSGYPVGVQPGQKKPNTGVGPVGRTV